MLRAFLLIFAVEMVSTGVLLADKPAPVPPAEPGFHNVPIKSRGGKIVSYIRVQNPMGPGASQSSDGLNFSKTDEMAHQSYDTGNTASSHDTGEYQKSVEHTFITQSYFANNSSGDVGGLHSDANVLMQPASESSRHASGMDATFYTAKADIGKPAEGMDTTSSFQGKTADLGGHKIDSFAATGTDKKYTGREMADIHRDEAELNEGLMGVKDLPNRPLTIDEVRALINHGVKPNLNEKPEVPSKALNDPDYMPEEAPAPLRTPVADPHHLHDLNDLPDDGAPPPPGAMAHPETDSQPLPQ